MATTPLKIGIVSANWSLKVHGAAWRRIPDVESPHELGELGSADAAPSRQVLEQGIGVRDG